MVGAVAKKERGVITEQISNANDKISRIESTNYLSLINHQSFMRNHII